MKKRCILCNKPYDYKYAMFGRGCLDNLYGLLEFSKPPRIVWNKELYLCTIIAWKNHKFFLSKRKKYALTQKYIALNYLNRMNYNFLDDIKNKIKNDINNISVFSKNIVDTISFTLNDIYKLFNYAQKFDELTDFKQLKEYTDKKDNILTDMMATTLNNFGVVSSEYGVLKIYDLKINLKLDSTQLYEEDGNER